MMRERVRQWVRTAFRRGGLLRGGRRLCPIVGLLLLACPGLLLAPAAEPARRVPLTELLAELKDAPQANRARAERMVELFRRAGIPQGRIRTQEVRASDAPNVTAMVPGRSGRVIVICAHTDHTPQGSGILDDWSGSIIVANLARSVVAQGVVPRHTLWFVGFTAEEQGLVGSREYWAALTPEQRASVDAVLCFECLGASHPWIWLDGSADELETRALADAAAIGVDLQPHVIPRVATDSVTFETHGIPALVIDGLSTSQFGWIDSPLDQWDKVRAEHYDDAFRLAVQLLDSFDRLEQRPSGVNLQRLISDSPRRRGFGFNASEPLSRTVMEVSPGSPPAAAGLRAGDEIEAVGMHPVADGEAARGYLARFWPGQRVELKVRRAGRSYRISYQKLGEDRGSKIMDRGSWIEDRGSQEQVPRASLHDPRSPIHDPRSTIHDPRSPHPRLGLS